MLNTSNNLDIYYPNNAAFCPRGRNERQNLFILSVTQWLKAMHHLESKGRHQRRADLEAGTCVLCLDVFSRSEIKLFLSITWSAEVLLV